MESIYNFSGLWGVPSKCGLKVIQKGETVIIIVTELYDENPGTSVTKWSAQLATELLAEYGSSPEKFIFIERNPGMNSKLNFYDEQLYMVTYDWDGTKYVNPRWDEISPEQLEDIIKPEI
ncbi:MAG: hypothetical protein KJ607_01320 [Bacteroidetes bacterium]|nr:hypothetical protein [Bacteroidota bacterium]